MRQPTPAMPLKRLASMSRTMTFSRTPPTLKELSASGKRSTGFTFSPSWGALLGLTSGILLTSMTQVAYPMVTGGKPILSLPPMAIVSYEGTMLGAILFTVLGIIFESRLPKFKLGLYDTRITEGYIGVLVNTEEDQLDQVQGILGDAGAVDVKRES